MTRHKTRRTDSSAEPSADRSVRLADRLFAPADATSLAIVRIGFGLIMMWDVCRLYLKGFVELDYIQPMIHFRYFGFSWLPVLPGPWIHGMFALVALSSCGICLGLCYRISAALFVVSFGYLFFLDESSYLNHFYLVLLFDLLIVPLLLYRRTRKFAFILVLGFHITNNLMHGIGIFPWMMIATTTIFFVPDWPRRWIRRAKRPASTVAAVPSARTLSRNDKCVLTLAGLYVTVQVLIPLRHLAYPGNVNWTEEGHRYAWQMKLRGKQGFAMFYLYDPQTKDASEINPAEYL